MRYWWVNQNQTHAHEIAGGYLWSPKAKANGDRNPYYEFMREVALGDLIFCFYGSRVQTLGVALGAAYTAPKPLEFGRVGAYWDKIGWRVDVRFEPLSSQLRPVEHMARLGPYLPGRYAPLHANGLGQQSIYLTEVPLLLAQQLVDLIGSEARAILQSWTVSEPQVAVPLKGQLAWEEHELEEILSDARMPDTEREAIVLARRGQGVFRSRVSEIERRCRITGATNPDYLRASHTKPWRESNNFERLDGENGLLLTPDADLLFDRGYISFESNGDVLVSPVVDRFALDQMGITPAMLRNVGTFSEGQRQYLEFHRAQIFLEARITREA